MTRLSRRSASRPHNVRFGRWFRSWLRRNSITQSEVSDETGIYRQTISSWVCGYRAPHGLSMAILAEALHKLSGRPHAEIASEMLSAYLASNPR